MNKKVIAMAVAAALAAPMIAQADGSVSFKADARYRMGNIAEGSTTLSQTTDSRVRLFIDAKNDAGISAHVRIQNVANDPKPTSPDPATGTTVVPNKYSVVDEAYVEVPVMGGMATLKAGDQLANFGTGFGINKDTAAPQRISLAVPLGAWQVVLMDDEKGDSSSTNGNKPGNNLLVAGKVAGWKLALLSVNKTGVKNAGTYIFASGMAGPVGLTIESDTQQTSASKAPTGTLLMGMMPLGSMNLHFGYASTANGFTAGSKFNPVSTIGTDQKTGMFNFGATGDTTAELVGIDMMAGPGKFVATIGAGSYKSGTATPSLSILDLQYHIPMNKTSDVAFTYGSMSSDTNFPGATWKSQSAYGLTINTKF